MFYMSVSVDGKNPSLKYILLHVFIFIIFASYKNSLKPVSSMSLQSQSLSLSVKIAYKNSDFVIYFVIYNDHVTLKYIFTHKYHAN